MLQLPVSIAPQKTSKLRPARRVITCYRTDDSAHVSLGIMRIRTVLFAFVTLTCVGCPQDPAETVTLNFTGNTATTERVLKQVVPRLLDRNRMTKVSYQHGRDGLTTRATVSPVSDVELFVGRCSFGAVVRRENRKLWITVDPVETNATITNFWMADRVVQLVALWTFIRSAAREKLTTGTSNMVSKIAITMRG